MDKKKQNNLLGGFILIILISMILSSIIILATYSNKDNGFSEEMCIYKKHFYEEAKINSIKHRTFCINKNLTPVFPLITEKCELYNYPGLDYEETNNEIHCINSEGKIEIYTLK